MKQLEKLGFQGSRVLTDDQMKNVKGGTDSDNCTRGAGQCAAVYCEVYDMSGHIYRGRCTRNCLCELENIPPDIV